MSTTDAWLQRWHAEGAKEAARRATIARAQAAAVAPSAPSRITGGTGMRIGRTAARAAQARGPQGPGAAEARAIISQAARNATAHELRQIPRAIARGAVAYARGAARAATGITFTPAVGSITRGDKILKAHTSVSAHLRDPGYARTVREGIPVAREQVSRIAKAAGATASSERMKGLLSRATFTPTALDILSTLVPDRSALREMTRGVGMSWTGKRRPGRSTGPKA